MKTAKVEIINEYGSVFTYVHRNNAPINALETARQVYESKVGGFENAVQITIKLGQEEK